MRAQDRSAWRTFEYKNEVFYGYEIGRCYKLTLDITIRLIDIHVDKQ